MSDLRALAEKATPGPWHQYVVTGEYVKAGNRTIADCRGFANSHDDAAYIAAASPDVILRLLDERDAAIRRASELEAALRNLVFNDTEHFDYEGSQPVPPHEGIRPEYCMECDRIRLGWMDEARAALRSQESQKPPETEDR